MDPDRILVTGAGGHVGSRLVARLFEDGQLVRASYRHSSRIPHDWGGEDPVIGDLIERDVRWTALGNVRTVAHLATRGFSNAYPPTELLLQQETEATLALASDAAERGVRTFLFVSTVRVYGSALVGDVTETSLALPSDLLGRCKLELERQLLRLSSTDFRVIVVRLANSFGVAAEPRRTPWDLLINELCREAVSNGTMTLRTDGRQYRDFVALGEVVRSLARVVGHHDIQSGVYLLASGRTRSLAESVERLAVSLQQAHGIRAVIRYGTETNLQSKPFHLSTQALERFGIRVSDDWSEEIRQLVAASTLCKEANS